jgi:hypothetical protein
MREDNPATELMNSLAECLNACGMLCLTMEGLRDAILDRLSRVGRAERVLNLKVEGQRDAILDAVSWFIEAAPLNDLPTMRVFDPLTKDMIRNAAAVAAKMQPLVLAWDGTTEPPPSLVRLAHEFLVSIGMDPLGIQGDPP